MPFCDISGGRLHLVKQFKTLKDHWASNDSGPGVHFSMLKGLWGKLLNSSSSPCFAAELVLLRIERWWVWVTLACCGLSRHRAAVPSKINVSQTQVLPSLSGRGKTRPPGIQTHTHTPSHTLVTPPSLHCRDIKMTAAPTSPPQRRTSIHRDEKHEKGRSGD